MTLWTKFYRLLKPFWRSKQSRFAFLLLFTILGMIFAIVKIQVMLNDWNSNFFDALGAMNIEEIWKQVALFPVILAFYVVIAVNRTWLIKLLTIRWRQWLTEYYLDGWLKDKRYYHYLIEKGQQRIDNPDQRIAEDVNLFITQVLTLSLGFIQSFSMLITFIVVLWTTSGALEFTLFERQWRIPGYLVYAVFILVIIGTTLAHVIGKKIRPLNVRKQRNEANFRRSLIRQQEYAEQIAFNDAEAYQHKKLSARFDDIKTNWCELMDRQRKLDYWQNFYQRTMTVIPYFLLLPQFISGVVTLGGLMKARQAFMLVSNNLSWFIYKYDALAELAAVIDRLYQFHQLTETSKPSAAQRGEKIVVENGNVSTPQGEQLLTDLNLSVNHGDWLLIKGPSGLGKTTLLRTISGIWPYASGRFVRPDEMFTLTQTPHLDAGRLSSVLSFPAAEDFSREKLEEALETVGLEKLISRLDEDNQWETQLSSGEKQRIGLARIFLFRPDWLLLDEATSHLGEEMAFELLQKIKRSLPNTGVVFVSHQQVTWDMADSVYQL